LTVYYRLLPLVLPLYAEGLRAEPWHDTSDIKDYPWAGPLEEASAEICAELSAVMSRKGIEQKGTNVWAAAAREDAMAYGPDWVCSLL
jgi:hypothetical protein